MPDDNTDIGTDPAGSPGAPPSDAGAGAPPSNAIPAPEPGTEAPPSEGAQPPGPGTAQPPTPGQPGGAAAPTPWKIRADRGEFFIEGSRVMPDGSVTIPQAQLQLLQQLIAEGAAHRGSWRQRERDYENQIAELRGSVEKHPDLLRARAFNQKLQELMEQGPEAVAEWLDKFETNRPILEAEVKAALLQSQLDERTTADTEREEQARADELVPVMEEALQGVVQELSARFPGVDASRLYQRMLTRYADQVFYEVPAQERARGLGRGEQLIGQSPDGAELYIMDRGLVEEEFDTWAGLVGGGATGAAKAVAQNAAALRTGAPPVAAGAGAAVQAQPTVALPKTQEELDEWMANGKWKGSFPATAT